jgi:hypothetical protein
MPERPYCPDPRRVYVCPYCGENARLLNAGVVIDCYKNVCHVECYDRAVANMQSADVVYLILAACTGILVSCLVWACVGL